MMADGFSVAVNSFIAQNVGAGNYQRAKKGYRAGDTETMVVNRSGEDVTIDFTFDSEPQDTNDASTTATPDDSRNDNSYSYGYGYDPYSFFDWIA